MLLQDPTVAGVSGRTSFLAFVPGCLGKVTTVLIVGLGVPFGVPFG